MIEAQATIIILAGSETTAIALTAAAYHILSNHNVYKKLCDEIRSSFASPAEIVLQDVLAKLPYLDAVVKEALRIHPPIANGFTRIVPDSGGVTISGHWVPQATVVTINHYCANTSARNFRDPHTFIPDRWLGDPAYDGDKKDVVQPFSVGPRDCPGKRFALNNIKLTLAHLIWSFDMKLGVGTRDWAVDQKIFNGWLQPALPVLLEKR